MKKFNIIMCLLGLLLTTNVSANDKTITLINASKPGGEVHQRTQIYKEGLEKRGWTIDYQNIGNESQSVKFFKKSKTPTLLIYTVSQLKSVPEYVVVSKETFIVLEFEQPFFICSPNSKKLDKSKPTTVGYGKGYSKNKIGAIIKELGYKNIKLVPYTNSGAVLKGLLAEEIDIAFNNQGKSTLYMESKKGVCWAQTLKTEYMGVPSANKVGSFDRALPTKAAILIGKNIKDKESLRAVAIDILKDKSYSDFLKTSESTLAVSNYKEELTAVENQQIGIGK
jgi:hypothetical protein